MSLYVRTLSGETIVATPLPGPPGHFVVTDMNFASYGTGNMRLSILGGQSTLDDNLDHAGAITAVIADPGQPQTGGSLTGVVATLQNFPEEINSSPGNGDGYLPGDFTLTIFPFSSYVDFVGPGVAKSLYFWAPPSIPGAHNVTAYFKDYVITLDSLGGGGGGGGTLGINPFNFERGVTQWRTRPTKSSASNGSFVFTLGYDGTAPNIEELAIGDYIQVAQSVNVTGVGVVRVKARIKQPDTMPDYEDISRDFQFIAESISSQGNKIVISRGVSESDVGRTVTVSGATNGANNGALKIVGICDPITAYVNKTVVTEGPKNGTIVAIESGARWKFSLLVDDGLGGQVERARVVQDKKESGFFRGDLAINVSKMSGAQNIYFRMTLIDHNINNIYSMP